MTLPTTKWIPASEGIVGKKYYGYIRKSDKHIITTFGRTIYIGNGFIEGDIEVINLEQELTWEERESLIKEMFNLKDTATQLNLYGLFNDMYGVGDAVHEMWNGWIDCDWYRMNLNISDENFVIIGIAPVGPRGGFKNPIGIVCEYEDGCRFWCHAEKDWIDKMREQMKETYVALKERKN